MADPNDDPVPEHFVGTVDFGDNLNVLRGLPDASVDLIYIDPPFNTGRQRSHQRQKFRGGGDGKRIGFGERHYVQVHLGVRRSFDDDFDDYLSWLGPRLIEAHRVLAAHGSLYVHLDYREVHYVKVFLDGLFGRDAFLNEIVWAYDFGGRPTRRWPAKHDTILFYAKEAGAHYFDREAVERIPYMAPGLVGEAKAKRGKLPTDTWWHTIVPTAGKERTGYPTQKPLGILRRVVGASSRPGDLVLDFCAGSGTTGEAAYELGRRFHLVDDNPEAMEIIASRLHAMEGVLWRGWDPERGKPAPGERLR